MAKKYSVEWWQELKPEKVGKETELLVESALKKLNVRQDFAWHRLPDARAARGALKAQPGDYQYIFHKVFGYIEVKALKHPTRLPATRLTQLPIMNKWEMAGASSVVLVHHYMTGEWRAVSPAVLPVGATSWDLSSFKSHATVEEALNSIIVFDIDLFLGKKRT